MPSRPALVVDNQGFRLRDPFDGSHVGIPAPFGRERCLQALATNESGTGPVLVTKAGVLFDRAGFGIADPDGTLIGCDGVWVHRLLDALYVEDTRRLR